jgi:hypothetical protein
LELTDKVINRTVRQGVIDEGHKGMEHTHKKKTLVSAANRNKRATLGIGTPSLDLR